MPESSSGYPRRCYPLVAAVADEYNEPVLTRNATDFRQLGVDVETY
ncbi:MAG: hypothetical protein ABEH88_06155 [Halobacteriales archaeon]